MGEDRHVRRPVFPYGIQPAVKRRKALILNLGAVATLLAAVAVLPAGYRLYDASRRNSVERALRAAPNVQTVTTVDSDNGPLPSKVVSATVRLSGVGNRVIQFHKPTTDELSSGDHIRLSLVGAVGLYTTCRGVSVDDFIDVGRDGAFAGMLPFQVRNVQDLTSHYDQLLAFIESLPATGTYKARDGSVHEFSRE